MSEKKLYIHVGLGKCGSTSIQDSLSKNVRCLNEQGYDYYPVPRVYIDWFQSRLCEQFGEYSLKNWMYSHKARNLDRNFDVAKIHQAVSAQIRGSSYNNIVISCELFCGSWDRDDLEAPKRASNMLLDGFNGFNDITIVFVIRNQVNYIWSFYKHDISLGDTLSFDEYFDKLIHLCDWHKKVNEFKTVFSNAEIIVLPFEALVGRGVVTPFCDAIGVTVDDQWEVVASNIGIPDNSISAMRELNEKLTYAEIQKVRRQLQKIDSVKQKKSHHLSQKQVQEIGERFHESNQLLFREYNLDQFISYKQWASPYLDDSTENKKDET